MLNIELYITPIAISSDIMNDLEGSKTFKIIVKIKQKTYISYVFMYMYVKIASKWPQN